MMDFINYCYLVVAHCHGVAPSLELDWIGCLEELGKFRIAVDNGNDRDLDLWSRFAQNCKSRGSVLGRLFRHLKWIMGNFQDREKCMIAIQVIREVDCAAGIIDLMRVSSVAEGLLDGTMRPRIKREYVRSLAQRWSVEEL